MSLNIPLVDISCLLNRYTTEVEWDNVGCKNDTSIQELVKNIKCGFETWGFIYVKGHGIPEELIQNAFNLSRTFFQSPNNFKLKLKRENGISVGYLPPTGEVFDEKKPMDLKELLDFALSSKKFNERLAENNPELVTTLETLFKSCKEITSKFLYVLAVAMDIEAGYFVEMHTHIGDRCLNGTSLRTLYYPSTDENLQDGQLRCGEHTDYGTITLLFQDQVGGLEILSPYGKFVTATPIAGSIIINAGDLMKLWSNGQFQSTVHRVTPVPLNNRYRQSIAFFVHPDYDVSIKYDNEQGEMKTKNAKEHLKERFESTIKTK